MNHLFSITWLVQSVQPQYFGACKRKIKNMLGQPISVLINFLTSKVKKKWFSSFSCVLNTLPKWWNELTRDNARKISWYELKIKYLIFHVKHIQVKYKIGDARKRTVNIDPVLLLLRDYYLVITKIRIVLAPFGNCTTD